MDGFDGVKIFHICDSEWNEYLSQMPEYSQDIYYTSEYHRLYEKKDVCYAELFVYEEAGKVGFFPYMKYIIVRQWLTEKYYDFETVYGYGGPITNTDDVAFTERFERKFEEYCDASNIIAGFYRFHPLIKNENVFRNVKPIHNRVTVAIDLKLDEEDLWMTQVSTKNRNVIRKCQNTGLKVRQTTDYTEFKCIYEDTMRKVNAEDFYYFENNYYEQIYADTHYTLLECTYNDEVIAAAIFMGFGKYFHYHLAGSKKDMLKLSPNNLLLWEAIRFGKNSGYEYMHLGGGLSDSEEDSLFRFKSKYSKLIEDFYIGKKIYKEDIYNRLIEEWEAEHNQKAKLLLQYRIS